MLRKKPSPTSLKVLRLLTLFKRSVTMRRQRLNTRISRLSITPSRLDIRKKFPHGQERLVITNISLLLTPLRRRLWRLDLSLLPRDLPLSAPKKRKLLKGKSSQSRMKLQPMMHSSLKRLALSPNTPPPSKPSTLLGRLTKLLTLS